MSDATTILQAINTVDPSDPSLQALNTINTQRAAYDMAVADRDAQIKALRDQILAINFSTRNQIKTLTDQITAIKVTFDKANPPATKTFLDQAYATALQQLQTAAAPAISSIEAAAPAFGSLG